MRVKNGCGRNLNFARQSAHCQSLGIPLSILKCFQRDRGNLKERLNVGFAANS